MTIQVKAVEQVITQQDYAIPTARNIALAGTLFRPVSTVKGAILIAPATGIKRQFYQHFAHYLSAQGYGVLTFDNEGIGESLSGGITHCTASLQTWGENDLPAALDYLTREFPQTSYQLIGHSAGGQLVGLMPNASVLNSVFNIACSSGQLSNMHMPYWLKAQFFMNLFIPLSNLLFRCTHSNWASMGEKLPKQVAQQWRQWCNGQGYVKTAFNKSITQHYYDDLTLPIHWVNATDDDIANDKNVDDMISVFTRAQSTKLTLSPEQHGLKEIGHMKFFIRKSNPLWTKVNDWLDIHTESN